MSKPDMSRRGLFTRLLGRSDEAESAVAPAAPIPGTIPGTISGTIPGPIPAASAPRVAPARPARAGTFAISEHLCIAWRGTSCSTCRERCPLPGALVVEAGRPRIDPAVCDGCGACVPVCPAPILAIRFSASKAPA